MQLLWQIFPCNKISKFRDKSSAKSGNRAIKTLKNLAEKAKVKQVFYNSKYALLKPENFLTKKQALKLKKIQKALPNFAKMHAEKEALRDICEGARSWGIEC